MRLTGSECSRRNAKRLRKEMTPLEIALWLALRRNEPRLRFRRQYAAGNYVLDFYCAPAKLAIEVDGEAHNRGDRPTRDIARDTWLVAQGIQMLRYPARALLSDLDDVVRQILHIAIGRSRFFETSSPPPPPSGCRLPPPPGGGG